MEAEIRKEQQTGSSLKMSDFCDMAEFEKILSDWTITTDMSAIVIDTDHRYITKNFSKLAADYRLDDEKLRTEYESIKTKSREKIEAARALLSSSVNSFVEKSYERWQRRNENRDDRTLSQITQILYAYNLT